MKLLGWVVCLSLSVGCGAKVEPGAVPGGTAGSAASADGSGGSAVTAATVTEVEYAADEARARVLLKVAPGATVTAKSKVGRWAFESMTSESGGAQFNVTLDTPLGPGQELALVFEVELAGKVATVEALVKAGGSKPLDLSLGFAPSEPGDGKRQVVCRPGALRKGEGDKVKHVADLCGSSDTTSFYLAKGEHKLKLVAASKDLGSLSIAGVEADFVDGRAELAVDLRSAIATSSALAMVGYEGQLMFALEAEGPGGPYHGDLPLEASGDLAHGWLLAAAKGPSVLDNERKRPARKGVMAAIRKPDATGGLLWGLFVNGMKEESNSRIKAQEIDLVAIDSGTKRVVGTCKYERESDGAKSDRDQINISSNITVYDRKTGAKVASRVFEPKKHPGCATEIQTGDGNFVNKADLSEIEAWAKGLVTDSFVHGIDDAPDAPAVAATAPDVAATNGAASDAMKRLNETFLGFPRHATPAQVEAALGPPSETQPDDTANTMRTRLYLGGAVSVSFDLPADTVDLIAIGSADFVDALAARGVSDPIAGLFNQKLDAVMKLLGKPKKAYEVDYEWNVGTDRVYTDLQLHFAEGRCTMITVMWITVRE